jgi:cob(I)alamin adenosyltransferase
MANSSSKITERKSCLHVYTGNGKGKTTAAIGLAVRAAGAGFRVFIIQFIKGGTPSSELLSLEELGIRTLRTATKPTGLLRGGATPEDHQAANEAFLAAQEALSQGQYDLIVLDEINIALHHNLVSLPEFLNICQKRSAHTEVVCTGRYAPQELLNIADLVTEMADIKHPFRAGIPAREGIEY